MPRRLQAVGAVEKERGHRDLIVDFKGLFAEVLVRVVAALVAIVKRRTAQVSSRTRQRGYSM